MAEWEPTDAEIVAYAEGQERGLIFESTVSRLRSQVAALEQERDQMRAVVEAAARVRTAVRAKYGTAVIREREMFLDLTLNACRVTPTPPSPRPDMGAGQPVPPGYIGVDSALPVEKPC